jgi:hypothetical protein
MLGGTLGFHLHDPLLCERVFIERIGAWEVWGSDRRCAGYAERHRSGNNPLQFLRETTGLGLVSVLTPCVPTNGRFELLVGTSVYERHCCQKCVRSRLRLMDIKDMPEPEDWICYLMLESHSFIEGGPTESGR